MKKISISSLYLPILILITFILTLIHSNNPQITFTDELLFEEASFRIARGDSLLIPQLGPTPWLEKPPLYFWLTAPLFHLINFFHSLDLLDLSQNLDSHNRFILPFIRRFWTIIAAHITIICTFLIARRLFTPLHGFLSGLLLLTTPLFLFTTLAASLDLTATAFITLSIYLYLKILKKHPHPQAKHSLLLSLTIALAFMTRSLLALSPLAVIILHQLIISKFKTRNFLITLTVLTTLLILPWHLYAYLHHPSEFLNVYLGFNIIDHGLKVPPGYATSTPFKYLRVLLIQNPWFLIIFTYTLYKLYQSIKTKTLRSLLSTIPHSPLLPIALWLLIPLLILSAAATRHEWYLIQILPPIAILATPLILKARTYTLNHPRQTLQHLTEIFFISFLLTSPAVVFTYRNNSAPVIDAIIETSQLIPENHPIYTYDQPYLPQTLLFAPRPIRVIINPDQLNQAISEISPLYIFIANQNIDTIKTLHPTLQLIKEYTPGGIYMIPNTTQP